MLNQSSIMVDSNLTLVTANVTAGGEVDAVIPQYCGKGLDDFHSSYGSIHGYVALLVCIFGSIANSLNIVVLTRREMKSSTNAILTGLAIADLLVMIDYIPFAMLHWYSREDKLAYHWVWYTMFHSIFAHVLHTISIWLTVTLAVWRCIAVVYPQKNRLWCNMKTTLIAITSSYIVCPLLAIPAYIAFSIHPFNKLFDLEGNMVDERSLNATMVADMQLRNITVYRIQPSQVAEKSHLLKINFWIYSVVIKLVPCVALTILSLRLIYALLDAKQRRKQLMSNSNGMKTIVNGKVVEGKGRKNSKVLDKERQTDRTTRMLLAVLLLFLITEFPQGILGLLSAVLHQTFLYNCYLKLGDLMDILALINSAINFILYCAMSRQFRTTFNQLFRPKWLDRWLPVPQGDDDGGMGRTDGGGRDNNGATTVVTNV